MSIHTSAAPSPLDLADDVIPILDPGPSLERLAYRYDELPLVLGISRRTIERERSAGRFPKPDRTVGKMPLWAPETIRQWVGGGDQ